MNFRILSDAVAKYENVNISKTKRSKLIKFGHNVWNAMLIINMYGFIGFLTMVMMGFIP